MLRVYKSACVWMKNQTPTYGNDVEAQMPQGPEMPQQTRLPMRWRRPMGRRKQGGSFLRQLQDVNIARDLTIRQARTLPNWLVGKPIVFFFIALFACWGAFGYIPAFDLWFVAAISVVLFFYGGYAMLNNWANVSEKRFLRNIFITGLIVRLLWMLYCYFFFNPSHYGTTYGDGADVEWYMPFGEAIAEWVRNGFNGGFDQLKMSWDAALDDIGYPIWLGVVYLITGSISDVFVPFIVKSVVGSYCAICIYRVAQRHFGDGTARLAALFVCLNPNIIYWCGTMMKETEMVFLVCIAVDNLDRILSSGNKLTFKSLLPGMLAAIALMFFRTALGLVMFFAMFAHIVMASKRVMSIGKKVLAGVLVVALLVISMGDRIINQSKYFYEKVRSGEQKENMEWRGHRVDEGGRKQSFAKYAGAAVFAPLIFTIPFPTFNEANVAQLVQVQTSGGSYIRNIFSFFVIMVLLSMLLSGEWRQHVFILAYTCGYLLTLVFSPFAQSGRFHMPIWPMLMLFAAYGIQVAKVNMRLKRLFTVALCLEVVVCLAWNWFKLAGRGMI